MKSAFQNNDVTVSLMVSQTQASRLIAQPFALAHIKENINAARHWPLWEESPDDRRIPITNGQ